MDRAQLAGAPWRRTAFVAHGLGDDEPRSRAAMTSVSDLGQTDTDNLRIGYCRQGAEDAR